MTTLTPKSAVLHRALAGSTREPNLHLPPHLREVCALLAVGLVRLRRRSAEDTAPEATNVGAAGESSLHFVPKQSGGGAHATRKAA